MLGALALISITTGFFIYVVILSGILLFLWPLAATTVLFWEIFLVPLELISPITFTTGIILIYISMS